VYGTSNYVDMGILVYGDKSCKWCGDPKQNRIHLLLKCPRSQLFWKTVENEFGTIFASGELTEEVILIGSQCKGRKKRNAADLLILLTIQMIFESVVRDFDLTIEILKVRLKSFLIHENRVNFEKASDNSYKTNIMRFEILKSYI
jgi:hypothetical protein